MAFLRIKRTGAREYFYIVESRRRGTKVAQRILEYLGESPDRKRIEAACRYWKVAAPKPVKRSKRR